ELLREVVDELDRRPGRRDQLHDEVAEASRAEPVAGVAMRRAAWVRSVERELEISDRAAQTGDLDRRHRWQRYAAIVHRIDDRRPCPGVLEYPAPDARVGVADTGVESLEGGLLRGPRVSGVRRRVRERIQIERNEAGFAVSAGHGDEPSGCH